MPSVDRGKLCTGKRPVDEGCVLTATLDIDTDTGVRYVFEMCVDLLWKCADVVCVVEARVVTPDVATVL